MNESKDTYFDDLGIAWCAINPQINVIAARLRQRLRRQSLAITAGLVAGVPVGAAGVLLGFFTIWGGWSSGTWNLVARGMAIAVISALLLTGVLSQLPVRAGDAARALSEMVDLSIARAQRRLGMIRLGFHACAIATVLGLVGTALRTYLAGPPKLSPVVDLVVILVFALGLYFYRLHIKGDLERMRALRHALSEDVGIQEPGPVSED